MAAIDKAGVLRAIDANGDPVSGALLYFFAAGTTTPFTTYTDDALTVAHSHPIQADSTGAFPAIYAANASLKIDMRTAGDVSLPGHPIDNIDFIDLVALEAEAASQSFTDNLFVVKRSDSAVTTFDLDMSEVSTGAQISMTVPNVDFTPATEADLTTAEGRLDTNEANITSLTSRVTAAEALVTSGVSYVDDSLADLNARVGTSDDEFAYVTDDGTASNNGIYQRISGTWTKQAEIPDFVATKASQTALDAEELARETAVEYLSFKVFAMSSDPVTNKIVVDHTAGDFGTVSLPRMRFEIGSDTYTIGDDSTLEVFDLAEDNNPRVYIYANLTTLEFLSTGTKTTAAISDTIIPIGQSMYGLFTPYVGVEVETISDGVHYGARLHRISAVNADPDAQYIEWDSEVGTIDFPFFRVESGFGQTPFNVDGASKLLSNATNSRIYYYVDFADTSAPTIESTTSRTDAQNSTTRLRLGVSQNYVFNNECALPERDRAEMRNAYVEPITAQEQAFHEMEANPMLLPHFAEVYTISGTDYFFVDPPIDGMALEVPDGGSVYLNVHPGRSITLTSTGDFTMYAGDDRKFSGGSANDNQCVITSPTAGSATVTISRDAGARMNIQALGFGCSTTFSTITEPTPDEHVFIFGQSHGNSLFNSGLQGFQRAIDSGDFAITDSYVNFSNGSVGGTGVAYPEGASFWNTTDDLPGTLLNTAMDNLDDKTDVDGWPRASAFIFECGDADRAAFSANDMTVAELATVVGDVLDEVRDHCLLDGSDNPIAQCIMGIYGAGRYTDDNTGSTSDAAATAVRQAYLQAAAARSWVTVVECKAPRGRPLHDVHLNEVGAYRHAYEIGRVFAKAVHSVSADLYGTVTAAKTATQVVRVTATAPNSNSMVAPVAKFSGEQPGPNPFGFGLIKSGFDASTGLHTIVKGEVVTSNIYDLTVAEGEDVTGATLITHGGRLQDAAFGNFPRDDAVDATAGRGLQPALVTVTGA